MARSIWKGAISFGLVYIPVAVYPASQEDDIDFDWLDKRSMDPVGYLRVNKRTGKAVDKDNIVKGVKQEDGSYVLVTNDEIRAAWPKTTQTIAIEAFVKAEELPFVYLEKPYWLEPASKADKVYALLREAMIERGVVGVARVVMHTKEHLAALMPSGPALVLNTLRWATELRSPEALQLPAAGRRAEGLKEAELKMAGQLIDGMASSWDPARYHDQFAEAIHKLVAAKAEAGGTMQVTPMEPLQAEGAPSNVVDLSELLKQSLAGHKPPAAKRSARAAAAKTAAPRKAPASRTRAAPARKRAA
jgi:DNA end-binding protein Ku